MGLRHYTWLPYNKISITWLIPVSSHSLRHRISAYQGRYSSITSSSLSPELNRTSVAPHQCCSILWLHRQTGCSRSNWCQHQGSAGCNSDSEFHQHLLSRSTNHHACSIVRQWPWLQLSCVNNHMFLGRTPSDITCTTSRGPASQCNAEPVWVSEPSWRNCDVVDW